MSYGVSDDFVERLQKHASVADTSWAAKLEKRVNTALDIDEINEMIVVVKDVMYSLMDEIQKSPLPRFQKSSFLGRTLPISQIYEEDKALYFFDVLEKDLEAYASHGAPVEVIFER